MSDDFRIKFLIVDDEPSIRKLCVTIGASLGFECSDAESAEAALAHLETNSPDLVLLDRRLPTMSGDDLLRQIKALLPRTEVAIITGHGSIESAVEAMRLGAYDYITKPFGAQQLKLVLQRMKEKVRLVAENEYLKDSLSSQQDLNAIDGSSPKIQDVLRMISRLKDTRTPVLITGESGTGKELVARAIHFRGSFQKRPFVAVDCGSLVPTLIESELFGYEKGAFTGALKTKAGLFQAANGGTIFLDEIGELPLEMQAKLLRVLQEKEVRPVGSNDRTAVDVRVIAATNRDLETAYKNGTFRKDLYFRLNVVTIHLPPLRERRSDLVALVRSMLARFAPEQNVQVTPAAMDCLYRYDWPGNVRELENCLERALALGNGRTIDVHDLPGAIRGDARPSAGAPFSVTAAEMTAAPAAFASVLPAEDAFTPAGADVPRAPSPAVPSTAPPPPASTDLEEIERETIRRVFAQVNGDKALAGRMLGISRATLYRKLKRYGIATEKFLSAAVGANGEF
jgi:two-component system response regulator AtoC